jgi:thioredoxin-like negative regulator of GroEL
VCRNTGDTQLAEELLGAAHEAEPHREIFARDLARFLVENERPEEALDVLDRALAFGNQPDLQRLRDETGLRRRDTPAANARNQSSERR